MISYFLSFDRENKIILIKCTLDVHLVELLDLHLPAWRPGRYQLQNYAKNIRNFKALNSDNKTLAYQKTNRNTWQIDTKETRNICISYEYVTEAIDAGSSYCDQEIAYLNPINCLMYQAIDSKVEVTIEMDQSFLGIACSNVFKKKAGNFTGTFTDFHILYDSPIMLSTKLKTVKFNTNNTSFFFHYIGLIEANIKRLKRDLRAICKTQINIFGSFPESEYHFMLIIPVLNSYHGVEHSKGTMMVLGHNGILREEFYHDLLGLASHELFHAWNICKIRPQELLPYNYQKECYFDTCFVAEGFTTYYGDKILLESKVISKKMYLLDLETIFRRHFENADVSSQSLRESSIDLWVDGYQKPINHKRVSVYDNGAIVAFMIDKHLEMNNKGSLDDVMRTLYASYGNMERGYTYGEIKNIIEKQADSTLNEIFELAISGTDSIFALSQIYLSTLGVQLIKNSEQQYTFQKK